MNAASIVRPAHGELPVVDQSDAEERIMRDAPNPDVARHALELMRQGYTSIPDTMSDETCDAAIEAFHSWCKAKEAEAGPRRDEHGLLPRIVNLHLDAPQVARLFFENRMALEVQDLCFGYRTSLYSSLFFHRGSAQPLHRDVPFFCTEPIGFYFGMWVALKDTDDRNGALVVAEGGHRMPAIDPAKIRVANPSGDGSIAPISEHLWACYQDEVNSQCRELGISSQAVSARKGDTVLWHPLLPHGGSKILESHRTRYSVVFHTTPEHVPVYQADVFFEPEKIPSPDPWWSYQTVGDRLVADFGVPAKFQV